MAYTKTHMGVIDLETLAKHDDAAILSLGFILVPYDQFGTEYADLIKCPGLELKFDIRQQIAHLGRKVDKGTAEWWAKQSAEAKKVLEPKPTDVSLMDLHAKLDQFVTSNNVNWKSIDLYDRNAFDIKKLDHIYSQNLNRKVPWDYQACWEIATALKFLGFDRYAGVRPEDVPGMVYHNALHDACLDAYRLFKAFRAAGMMD